MSFPISSDTYFQGLLSQRLGPGRLIDDELVLLIIEDHDFQRLCTIYSSPEGDTDGIRARVDAKAKALFLPVTLIPPHAWAVWSAVLEDPRFDLIWKNALDQLREPLPVVRNSLLARFLAFLAKFKKPAEAASLLPLLLATIAATSAVWVLPVILNTATPSTPPPPKLPLEGLNETNRQLDIINQNLENLTKAVSGCGKCKETTSSLSGGPLTIPPSSTAQDIKPLITEVIDQENAIRINIGNVESAVQDTTKSVKALTTSTDKIQPAVTTLQDKIDFDATAIGSKLDTIGQNTATTLEAVRDPPASKGYINKTLADSRDAVLDIKKKQDEAATLQDTLKSPLFTVDSLRQNASFILEYRSAGLPLACIAFQVLQMNQDSLILRYRELQACVANTKAVGAIPADDPHTIRLSATPRLVSDASGIGAQGLYLSMEQERGTSFRPLSTRRAFVGAYSQASWTIHKEPAPRP